MRLNVILKHTSLRDESNRKQELNLPLKATNVMSKILLSLKVVTACY